MGTKRIVDRDFWTDDKVLNTFSPEDRLFMLYLLTCPDSTQLGIFKLNPRVAAFHLGYSPETIMVLLDRFETKYGIIKRSKESNEIAIKNYLCYSIVKGGKPVFCQLTRELNLVQDLNLIDYVFANISKKRNLNATVKEVISKYSTSTESIDLNANENENANANANAVSSANRGRIVDESSNVPPAAKNAFALWNSEICPLTQLLSEKIQALIDEVGELYVCQAIESAVLNGARSFNYVQAAARGIASGNQKPQKKDDGLLF